MAKKKVVNQIKLQIQAGKANPAPPVGTALGPAGIQIMDFCKQFNAQTSGMDSSLVIPVVIDIYQDRTFSFILKSPPVSVLIKKELGLASGSATPNRDKVGKLTMAQVEKVAKEKQKDMAVRDLASAMQMVIGTAKSMGIEVEGEDNDQE